ncbi:MAG TPA: hypothetical protein VFN44_05660 [Solirubrobacteraceae bacterium]|nr:hypothetical protein [Solirubrobacteraceae bacterium]
MTVRHTLLTCLAAAAFIAPAAQARPADMHASTAEAAAAKAQTQAQAAQDPRSPSARDTGQQVRRASQLPPAGQPTWPVNPTPLAPPSQEPAVDSDSSPAPIIPLVAGALVALITALTVRHVTHRQSRRTHIAA